MRLQTQVAPEIQKRLLLSRVEAESLKERDILCPTCGFRIQRVFSDATGHLSVKCQKCKNVHILNLAYFPHTKSSSYHYCKDRIPVFIYRVGFQEIQK